MVGLPDFQYYRLQQDISSALDNARYQSQEFPSRELSLVVTKLQEAQMWFDAITTDKSVKDSNFHR